MEEEGRSREGGGWYSEEGGGIEPGEGRLV